ncbi:hypothetical protein NQ315_009859 [Exocentrus adspersus]|uniref:Adenosine kinase n=1 Tax=Exocentrus adspersus TaxID=1586481 RepID=A0AAV8WH61_9CUCU|nr:hypothetical protein NQ315_009859 [Exocentrus adspersus]
MKKIVVFGNPLLDTTVFLQDNFLLDKYNLKEDDQKEITSDEMKRLSEDISGYQQHRSAGGCGQNSLRVLQWLTGKRCDAVIFGSVGKDKEADILRGLLKNDGVQTRYIEQDLPTGKTVALVKSPFRSLVAYIGAAEHLPLNDLLREKDFPGLVLNSDFVYIEGYFLTNREETAKHVLDYCNKHNKIVIFNICGKYVCDVCPETVRYFVENSDVIFGNLGEYEAVGKLVGIDTVDELTGRLIGNGRNKMKRYGNIIVITNGDNPGSCIYEGGKKESFPVPKLEKNAVKDTTGAGDAFTGGFIAGLCEGKSVMDCAKIGCYAALHIVQQIGCTLPNFSPNILD